MTKKPHPFANKTDKNGDNCDTCGEPAGDAMHKMYNNMNDGLSDSSGGRADGRDVNALRSLHDRLLAERPEGAEHDEDACVFCGSNDDDLGGGWMATFTDEELQAAVDAAVADATSPLKDRIAELETTAQQGEWEQAKADLEARVTELEAKLDAAVLEATQAKEERDQLQADWDAEKASVEEAKTVAARRDERLQKVREVASFPDAYLEQNADRFAAMSDDDFNARLEEWTAISKPAASGGIPKTTALTASLQDDSSALDLLREFQTSDPRTL
jgi:hypothetical protein